MTKTFAWVVVALAVVCSVAAGSLDAVLTAPTDHLPAGGPVELTVWVHNTGEEPEDVELPDELSCALAWQGAGAVVVAGALDRDAAGSVEVAPGAFVRRSYRIVVPDVASGPVRVELGALGVAAVLVVEPLREPSEPQTATQAPAAQQTSGDVEFRSLESMFSLYQPYLGNIAAYRPMYFLVGTDPSKSSFQFSFKYRFYNPKPEVVAQHPWARGFHFGFTQTSFWDLRGDSVPFEDTSYKPELFFLSSNIRARPGWIKGLFIQGGVEHESNGRGGEDSRSTNRAYVKPVFIFYDRERKLGLEVAPKVWADFENEYTNSDLARYRGYFDLELKFGRADAFVLGSRLRWASEGPSVQLDLTWPLHRGVLPNTHLYLQAQYVNALAESLIDYTERTEAFRLGVAIVR